MNDIRWQTGLPLTAGEREARKEVAIVRASVRIAVIQHVGATTKCLFVTHPVKGLEVPGGAIDPDEQPLDAALRELFEEAGLALNAADNEIQCAGFVPITDQQNGRWLDIVYVTHISGAQAATIEPTAAEFPVTWLVADEQLMTQLSANAQQIVRCALAFG